MRKLTLALAVAVSLGTTACAHNHWVAPAVIGGVVGYTIAQPRPVYYAPAPIYYNGSQQGMVCPYGSTPTYQVQHRYDNYGHIVTHNQWLGCR